MKMKTINSLICACFLLLATHVKAQQFEVKVSGKGQPILLFPGFANTGEVFKEIVGPLSTQYEVHTFTFAGFGQVAPISFPWLPQIKDGLNAYIKKNRLKNPIIIGHSLGGTLGLWLAATTPKTFAKLIIVDALPAMGALMIPNYKSENMVYDTPYNKQLLEMSDQDFKQMATQMAQSMSLNKAAHQKLADWMVMGDRKTYVYGYVDLLKLDLREELAAIDCPVTLLAATHPYGKQVAETNYKKQYQGLKKYSLLFAENAGHFIMYDQPEWFLTTIKSELQLK